MDQEKKRQRVATKLDVQAQAAAATSGKSVAAATTTAASRPQQQDPPIESLLKKIMYAEGDIDLTGSHLDAKSCGAVTVAHLRECIPQIVARLANKSTPPQTLD